MASDLPTAYPEDGENVSEQIATPRKEALPFLPSEIQLQNIFPIEIVARRFPINLAQAPMAQLSIADVSVDEEGQQAQAVLSVSLEFTGKPHPFDISFKILGQFTYAPHLGVANVTRFLEMSSLSVLLPFARELLLSICTCLQISPILFNSNSQVVTTP